MEQEGAFAWASKVYFVGNGALKIFDAVNGVIKSVPMWDTTNLPRNPFFATYAASPDGRYIYYGVGITLYRFNTQEETIDLKMDLIPTINISGMLLTPDAMQTLQYSTIPYPVEDMSRRAV
ncbi:MULTISPECIES: hypothetical protein [unclassified Paenibacillus]|uniref:hypothetical protein n=1 Tax=unclassified Paenibacillus TaxID=185978 RepID=UPI00096C9ACC|nr:hypothetical protein BK146_28470 [Paenibacillus sp. FSL R7-0333]